MVSRENRRPILAPPTTRLSATAPTASRARLHHLSSWWPGNALAGHAQPPIIDVPLTKAQLRHSAAGAPSNDDDLIRDEDFDSTPPSPTGQHESGRLCSWR
ncbi:hypothetical protein M405DRAFT_835341 [Rhizopogon salebrosus TDB-379]|nr:hypothetical protein M405DRAFT_835341 [Rhizopogon salebrosus TDB-379]